MNATRRLTGLAAFTGAILFVLGVPLALLTFAGGHLPTAIPTWQHIHTALSQPDNGTLLLGALTVAAWLAWVTFTTCLLLEAGARLRGLRPPTLPGLRWQQHAAGSLISAIALLFLAAPMAASAGAATPSHTTTPARSAHIGVARTAGAATPAQQADTAAQPAPVSHTNHAGSAVQYELHTVKDNETLWSISRHWYGHGVDYKKIAAANYDRPQPDGHTLTSDHWIRSGWVLRIPVNTAPAQTAPDHAAPSHNTPAHATPAQHRSAPPAPPHRQTPPVPHTQTPTQQPPTTAPAQPAPQPGSASGGGGQSTAGTAAGTSSATATDDEFAAVRTPLGVGAILAVGVIGLLGTGRTLQRRRRRPGTSIPMPMGNSALFEQELRATADPLSVELVDRALRTLHQHCTTTGTPLPVVRAARLTADQFDLYLDEPAQLPAPWTGMAGHLVWTLTGDSGDLLDAATARTVPAPYPSLVTIGHDDEDGHVFLDLEYLSALGITGGTRVHPTEVLAAIAVELATSSWADDLLVTIVGAYAELEDILQTGRVRYLPSPEHIIDELTTRADHDRAALAHAGGDLNHARPAGAEPGLWTPEIVLLAGELTADQRTRLTSIAQATPRVAIATVTAGEPIAEWALHLSSDDDTAILQPIGLHLRPQRIDAATYNQLLDVAAIAAADPVDADEQWNAPPLPAPADLPPSIDDYTTTGDLDPGTGAPAAAAAAAAAELPDALAGFITVPTGTTNTGGITDVPTIESAEPARLSAAASGGATSARDAIGLADDGEKFDDDAAADLSAILPTRSTATTPPPAALANEDGSAAAANDEQDSHPIPAHTAAADRPRLRLLGPVELLNAHGVVEPTKKARLTELAAYLALNPGANHHALDAAMWPAARDNTNNRNTSVSKLRRWLGIDRTSEHYMPRFSAKGGYQLGRVTSDWNDWLNLIPGPASDATTDSLEQALTFVTGRPLEGTPSRRYAWAEPAHQDMIAAITDAAYELARRRLMEGRWRAAERAAVIGINVDLTRESLWRARILAAHSSGNLMAEKEAIERMIAAIDGIACDLEPETEQLLAQLDAAGKADAAK